MSFPTLAGSDVQIAPGRGGWVGMDPHLYVSTWDNQFVFDLMPYVIDVSITHDVTRTAGSWILEATISIDGWGLLRPYVDWLSPMSTVHYADGSSLTRQLGHYLLLDSPEDRSEIGGTVRIDARDVLWVLSKQGLPDILIAPVGLNQGSPPGSLVNWGATVKQIIADATVPGGSAGSHLRENVPATNVTAFVGQDGPIFDIATPRLDACNDLLAGASWFPLHVTETGVIGVTRLQSVYFTTPIRRWLANPPAGSFQLGSLLVDPSPRERERSPIAETIQSTPSTADTIEQVIVTGGVTTPVTAIATITQNFIPVGGPGGIVGGGGHGGALQHVVTGSSKTVTAQTITSQSAAQALANTLLEQALVENTSLTLNVEPDPTFVSIHNTVTLGIWDAQGRQIANGIYAVNRVKYGLMPENPLMQIDVAAFDNFIPVSP